jgi:hypothetical protein
MEREKLEKKEREEKLAIFDEDAEKRKKLFVGFTASGKPYDTMKKVEKKGGAGSITKIDTRTMAHQNAVTLLRSQAKLGPHAPEMIDNMITALKDYDPNDTKEDISFVKMEYFLFVMKEASITILELKNLQIKEKSN